MISLEKTRQDLKSLNLATIILNFIFVGFSFLGLLGIIFLMSIMNNPEVMASAGQSFTPEELALAKSTFGILGLVITAISTIVPLVVAILAILNRKKIDANQPSLVPYYIGGGTAGILLVLSLFNGSVGLLEVAIHGGLLALYYFAIKKSKDLLTHSSSNGIIEN